MSSKNTAKKLARAVQDEVVKRRGGKPPSYMVCLNIVHLEMAGRVAEPPISAAQWQADVVERAAARVS